MNAASLRIAPLLPLLLLVVSGCGNVQKKMTQAFQTDESDWRMAREERLKGPQGWLSVAGLVWLHDGGPMTMGADPKSDVVLPAGAPAKAGVLSLKDGKVAFTPEKSAGITINGKPAATTILHPDTDDDTDVLQAGTVSATIIKRGDRLGVRMRDPNAPTRKNFAGLKWYPADEKWNITAKWVPYPDKRTIRITNILGMTSDEPSPGYVEFEIDGHSYKLHPYVDGNSLSFMFKDGTSGKETYPTGRFLDIDMPKSDTVTLDFNRAYNPPCAFIAYATCPIAPPENVLTASIPAGEKKYAEHD